MDGAFTAAQLEAALADPELLARSLAWAGLTVTRLDAEQLRVAATGISAIVRARVIDLRYELSFAVETPEPAVAHGPVTQALKFQSQGDGSAAAQWVAELDPLPEGASAEVQRWLPRILLAVPEQLSQSGTIAAEPVTTGRWIWILAFVVLLLALGLAV